jgi:hypothetical protein
MGYMTDIDGTAYATAHKERRGREIRMTNILTLTLGA